MISKMAAPRHTSTINQSGEAELLPRPSTTMPSNFGSHQLALDGRQFSQSMVQSSIPSTHGHYPLAFPNKQPMEVMLPSKNDILSVSVHMGLQQAECTRKLQTGMKPLPRIQNLSSVNVGTPFTLTSIKRQARLEYTQKLQTMPMAAGSHQLASTNKRSAQAELPVKVQEDVESVRSKLRESLSAALTCSNEQNQPKSLEKGSLGEEKTLLRPAEISHLQNETKTSASAADSPSCESLSNYLTPDKQLEDVNGNQRVLTVMGSSGNVGDQKEEDVLLNVQENQQNSDIVLDDVPFSHSIVEDELLQGHGLCWASDFTTASADSVPESFLKRPKLISVEEIRDVDTILQTSENLAAQIEAELFKLFGGVNKKYKEKGRSLLFNLKDPSNPELRERVLSGDVLPERLCSMSAEELASKELSQWRQAKAEEFAQMVMLPDMTIDIRRLVRKTHKGEFQVEVEQDDGAHPEVELGSDFLSKTLAKVDEKKQGPSRPNDSGLNSSKIHDMSGELVQGENSDSDERNVPTNLEPRFPEKTDDVPDFMVEEMKDSELLPPVISLDEFMQALDSEPPFENLEVNNLQETTSSVGWNLDRPGSDSIKASDGRGHKVDCNPDISVSKLASTNILDSQLHSGHLHSKHNKEISSPNPGQVAYNYHNKDDKMKPETYYEKQVSDSDPNFRNIWEGFLQLNVSSLSNVVSFFLSGEKTSMQAWPNIVEVKGRVRLDAFEKFLQELPLSRSRAVMIVEFRWKENSTESGQVHLSEAIHSYISDERVGFAEPTPGAELYLCPPHQKATGTLAKHLSKELLESVGSVVSGLVGIVVWRRPHAIVSPRLPSHHKPGSAKRHHPSSKKQHDRTSRLNSSHTPSAPRSTPAPQPDDIDDVPPGFGPPIVRDIDDLPEFDFSRQHSAAVGRRALPPPPPGPPPSTPSAPSSHMRELIHRYGQGGSNVSESVIPVQPWHEEDDIPEWNPNQNMKQMPQALPPPTPQFQMHGYQQFTMNQHCPMPQFQTHGFPPQNVLQQPNAPWWPAANGIPDGGAPPGGSIRPCHFWGGQPSGARPPVVGPRMLQGFGRANNGSGLWRPDNSGGRGF